MNDTLKDYKVTDRQTFIKFLDLLRKDFLDNPENWENKTLPDFLEALSAYTEDVQGFYDNINLNVNADKPDWSIFADIFKGAKMYESSLKTSKNRSFREFDIRNFYLFLPD